MVFSKELKAAMLADFAYQYNKNYVEEWKVDVTKYWAEIYRPGRAVCTSHFVEKLFEYCKANLHETPCISCLNEEIRFYL